jgi:hypothetical protein
MWSLEIHALHVLLVTILILIIRRMEQVHKGKEAIKNVDLVS